MIPALKLLIILVSVIPTLWFLISFYRKKLSDESKQDFKKWMKGIMPMVGLVIFYLVYNYYDAGYWAADTFFNKQVNTYMFLILLFYYAFHNFVYLFMYKSSRIIADEEAASCSYKQIFGDYVTASIGSINYLLTWKSGKKVLVGPKSKLILLNPNRENSNMVLDVKVKDKEEVSKLPPESVDIIKTKSYFRKYDLSYGEINQIEAEHKEHDRKIFQEDAVELEINNRSFNRIKGLVEGNPEEIRNFIESPKMFIKDGEN